MDPKMLIERTFKASVVLVIPFLFALLTGLVLLGITVARDSVQSVPNHYA